MNTQVTAHDPGQQVIHELPNGWSWVSLSEICDAVNGRAFKSSEWRDSGVPIIRIQNLKNPDASFNYFDGEIDDKHKVEPGDLLFAWSGTPGTSFGAHIWKGSEAALNQHIFNIQFDESQIDTKYFQYALNQNVARYVAQAQGGVGLAHITKKKFMASKIPIGPITEEKKLVAELDKQFSRLDEAVANLHRVKANFKRYKAAVLKAAVEGRLVETEAELARREGSAYETGEQLLQRILETRRSQWKGKGKYKEPAPPDTISLPELPEGWVWAALGQLSWSVKDGPHFSPEYSEDGIPFISGGNIRPEGIDFSNTKFISPELHEELSKRCKPELGDLLYTKGGTTGIARVNTESREFNVWVHVAVLKLMESVDPFYLQHALNSPHCYRQAQKYTHGVGNQDLGLTRMVWISVPLPSTEEQRRIVAEIDRRLWFLREIEGQVNTELHRTERLKQSILSESFGGSASPGSPNDQPSYEVECNNFSS